MNRVGSFVGPCVRRSSDMANESTDSASVGLSRDFPEFYRRELLGQVRRAALIVGDRDLANDLVHDAFVSVYGRWQSLLDPGPYLSTVVLNACRDATRRRGRHDIMLARHAAGSPRDVAPADARIEDDDVWRALAALPFRQRAAVALRYYEHCTEAEIAVALGCRPGSVGPLTSRALKSLRRTLAWAR